MGWSFIANIKGVKGDDGVGLPGPQGIPGTNAVPADTATGGYVGTDGTSVTKTALIDRAGVFNAKTDTFGGVAAALAATDHTSFLQAAMAACQARGFKQLIIPQLDPANPSRPWVLSGQLEPYAGLTVHAEDAEFKQTVIDHPVFYVAPTADHVSIHMGHANLDNGLGRRVLIADIATTGTVNGHTPRGNCAGVLSDAAHGTFTGRYSGFIFGVALTTPVGDTALREHNRVDITVDQVDFGLTYDTQNGGDFKVVGSYIQMLDSTDPAHLIYAVLNADIPTTNCVAEGNAWDGVGGVPFSFKAQKGAHVKSLTVRNCPGVLNVVDPLGPIVFDSIHGTDILTDVYGGGQTAAIETGFSGLAPDAAGTKTIGTARISFASSVSTVNYFRAANLDDDWTIGLLDISYQTNAVNNAQTMVQANGNRSHINALRIRNTGTGGIRGLRYVAGTKDHYLATGPAIIGGADAVIIDPGVLTSDLCVDEQIITPAAGYAKLVYTPDISNTVRNGAGFARRLRQNRWFAAPVGATSPVSPEFNKLCIVPVTFQRAVSIDKLGIVVSTAVPASTIRLGIYSDSGVGYPGALIIDGGTVDTSTTGSKTVTITKTTLPPGTYYLAYVPQGAAGVAVQGFPLTVIDFPSATQGGLTLGVMPTTAAVSGALPATWVFASDSTAGGVAKISYEVPV